MVTSSGVALAAWAVAPPPPEPQPASSAVVASSTPDASRAGPRRGRVSWVMVVPFLASRDRFVRYREVGRARAAGGTRHRAILAPPFLAAFLPRWRVEGRWSPR